MVVYGIRYLLETYLLRQWTVDDVEKAAQLLQVTSCGSRHDLSVTVMPSEVVMI